MAPGQGGRPAPPQTHRGLDSEVLKALNLQAPARAQHSRSEMRQPARAPSRELAERQVCANPAFQPIEKGMPHRPTPKVWVVRATEPDSELPPSPAKFARPAVTVASPSASIH